MEISAQGVYILSLPVFWEGWMSLGDVVTLYAQIYSSYSGNNTVGSYGWTSLTGHQVAYQ